MIFPFYIWILYEPIFTLKNLFLTRLYPILPSQIETKNWDTVLRTGQTFTPDTDKVWTDLLCE